MYKVQDYNSAHAVSVGRHFTLMSEKYMTASLH